MIIINYLGRYKLDLVANGVDWVKRKVSHFLKPKGG